jgi:hypothetical protein
LFALRPWSAPRFCISISHRKDALVKVREEQQAEQAKRDREAAEKTIAGLRSQTIARRISPEQKSALVAVLSPFAGQKITIICSNNAWDCINFATDFQAVFREAKWDTPNEIAVGIALGLDPVGVEFGVNPGWVSSGVPPAPLNVLGIAMVRLGFAREPVSIAKVPTIPFGTIEFRVGRIPPPPRDQYHQKLENQLAACIKNVAKAIASFT